MMGAPICVLFVVTLVISGAAVDAKNSVTLDGVVGDAKPSESNAFITIRKNQQFCQLCEEFADEAIYYLSENETQAEIINIFHQTCSKWHSLRQQCITLVDYYVPLLFKEIDTLNPEQLCQKVNLCEDLVLIRLPVREDACTLCHQVLAEILSKLEDPDTEIEIIALLLKGCSKVENYVQQCKKLVLEFGPLVLQNIEKFLQAKDVCTLIHACKASTTVVLEAGAISAA